MAKKSQSRKKRKQRKPNIPAYTVPADQYPFTLSLIHI